LGRFFIGSSVSVSESGGAMVAFLGGIFCTYDASMVAPQEAPQAVNEISPIWIDCFGDLVAVLSALGGTKFVLEFCDVPCPSKCISYP
jgi:hypothetical protein